MHGIRNDLPDQAMFIEWHGSNAYPQLHTNLLRDPTDNCLLNPKDFTPIERGHTYRYKIGPSGVLVYMPKRVMDLETMSVLRAFDPKPAEPRYKVAVSKRRADSPHYIWQHFVLDHDDFALFSKAAKRAGWELISGLYDLEDVKKQMESLEGRLYKWTTDVGTLQKATFPGGLRGKTLEEISDLLLDVENSYGDVANAHREYASKLLSWEANLSNAQLLSIASIRRNIQELSAKMYSVLLTELATSVRAALSGIARRPEEYDFARLSSILSELQSHYPVLNILSVDTTRKQLLVTVAGGCLRYDGVTAEVLSEFSTTAGTTSTGLSTPVVRKKNIGSL